MSLHLVSLADCPPQPWRNGGGVTRELLRWPPAFEDMGTASPANTMATAASTASGNDDWLLRVSVAEIARDGPFSPFAGVERWFAVLQGAGVRLALPAADTVLHAGDDPVRFAGEAAPGCTLIDGPTQDLNLMHRRGSPSAGPHAMMRRAAAGSAQRGRLPWRALYAFADTQLQAGDEALALPAGTLVWCDTQADETWECLATGAAYWMSLHP